MTTVIICSDFGAQENKVSHCFHCFPSYLPWCDGTGCHGHSFLMLSFKPTFSLTSFTFIKGIFSSSLSAIWVVSSAYLRLLIFLLAILIPACASSSPVFLMMCSAYKLNKQGDNIQPSRTPFPIWNQSVVPCPVLTVASWPAYRFLKRQVRWSGTLRIFHIKMGTIKDRNGMDLTEAQTEQWNPNSWQKNYELLKKITSRVKIPKILSQYSKMTYFMPLLISRAYPWAKWGFGLLNVLNVCMSVCSSVY